MTAGKGCWYKDLLLLYVKGFIPQSNISNHLWLPKIFSFSEFALDTVSMEQKEFQLKLGKQIAVLRKAKNITQVDFAYMLDMEKQNFNRIEKGRTNPTSWTLQQIATLLEIPIQRLFDFEWAVSLIFIKDHLWSLVPELTLTIAVHWKAECSDAICLPCVSFLFNDFLANI